MPTYPDVPNSPGVPSVPRNPNGSDVTTLAADPTTVTVVKYVNKWGIFDSSGKAPVKFDSFVSMEFGKEFDLPTYPIEEGSFSNYNKVEKPFGGTVRLSCGGRSSDRTAFIIALEALVASREVYILVTPERSYYNVNFMHMEYDRSGERGNGLIVAELRFLQIRDTTVTVFTQTGAPDGAAVEDGGHAQAQAPTAAQTAAFAKGGIH